MKKLNLKSLTITAMLVAVTAVLSQISIPLPTGVPITLQTFAVALCGYILGAKLGTLSIAVYIALGAVGVPVFSNFKGGVGVLIGVTGGFIFGFLLMALACGLSERVHNFMLCILFGLVGLVLCHLFGVIQFALLTGRKFLDSALMVSVPYLIKDVISVVAAYYAAVLAKKVIDKC